eukprot:Gb_04303 [translate_table: standard]
MAEAGDIGNGHVIEGIDVAVGLGGVAVNCQSLLSLSKPFVNFKIFRIFTTCPVAALQSDPVICWSQSLPLIGLQSLVYCRSIFLNFTTASDLKHAPPRLELRFVVAPYGNGVLLALCLRMTSEALQVVTPLEYVDVAIAEEGTSLPFPTPCPLNTRACWALTWPGNTSHDVISISRFMVNKCCSLPCTRSNPSSSRIASIQDVEDVFKKLMPTVMGNIVVDAVPSWALWVIVKANMNSSVCVGNPTPSKQIAKSTPSRIDENPNSSSEQIRFEVLAMRQFDADMATLAA